MELRETARNDDITQVALIGKLDVAGLHSVDVKFHSATAARRRNAIVDFSGVDFISSLGIGMLVSCAKSLARHQARMVIVNPQPVVEEVLRLTAIDQAVPIVRTVEDAAELLKR